MYQETPLGIILNVKITPKSSRNGVIGIENDAWKMRIAAPPEKGAANDTLVAFLSDILHIAKAHISLIKGQSSRHKRLQITGLTIQEIQQRLEEACHS